MFTVASPELGGDGGISLEGALDGVGGAESLAARRNRRQGRGGGGSGDGSSTKASTEFFGIGGYGKTFVYVVDASDSMNDRGKFERARYELLQSIEQLGSEQRYFVIFYNERAYPMDADKPLLATHGQRLRKRRSGSTWLNRTAARIRCPPCCTRSRCGRTRFTFFPTGNSTRARFKSCGHSNRQNLRLNIRQIPIHTIAFLDRIAEGPDADDRAQLRRRVSVCELRRVRAGRRFSVTSVARRSRPSDGRWR